MQAVGNFVVVEHTMNEEVIGRHGLVESVANTEADKKGKIISVGSLVPKDENLAVGVTIWFTKYDSLMTINNKKYLSIDYKNIVMVV